MSAAHLPDGLWHSLIKNFDAGVLILDENRVVMYANIAAANLLDYLPGEVRGLDIQDFYALCQPGRLDIDRLRSDLAGKSLPLGHVYAIMTMRRRLTIQLVSIDLDEESSLAMILRPLSYWRAELIARRTLNEMQGPLTLASGHAETLLHRLESGQEKIDDLRDLARISDASLRQVMDVWQALRNLDLTGAWALPTSAFDPIQIEDAMFDAWQELVARSGPGFPILHFDLPDHVPPVSGAPQLLHVGLCALLDGAAVRLKKRSHLFVHVDDRHTYLQVNVTAGLPGSTLQPHLFDDLPFAIVEQVVLQHGGRAWFDNDSESPACCFSLPVWLAES